jgi:predicted alpha-1,2-mannosidase
MLARFVLNYCLALLTIVPAIASCAQSAPSPYNEVDPLIGTSGGGNTFPGATLPFGMVQWSPDTNANAWYFYSEMRIRGFGLTHVSGAGCGLYGDFAVLPTPSALTTSPGTDFDLYTAPFDHGGEEAHPGYYAVTLASGIRVEITVTDRAGIARFVFPDGVSSRILVNAGSSANTIASQPVASPSGDVFGNQIELGSPETFAGSATAGAFCGSQSRYKIYVSGRFNKPYKRSAVWQDSLITTSGKTAKGKQTGAWLDFGDEHEVTLKVGVSFVSEAGARDNLDSEIPGWNFAEIHARALKTWSKLLDRAVVEGGNADQRKIFYTGFYHSFLSPNVFSDESGDYTGFDNKVHSLSASKQKTQYANFSDWDIYRNTVQLQALFESKRSGDMMQSLVNDAAQSGWLPRWPSANDVTYVMDDDAPAIVIADSYAFGARNFDVESAFRYMVKAGTTPGLGPHGKAERAFLAEYLKLGYVPIEKDDVAASLTLEYANADFAVAQLAKGTGHEMESKAFLKRSENWKNLLDPDSGWIRPRLSDGTWLPGFDAGLSLPKTKVGWDKVDQEGFEEGNSYQYTFMIPFDYPDLFSAIGGMDKLIPRLDKFFLKLRCWGEPCFNIENEPDFVVPYAYVFAGQPWKTQEVITHIEKEVFKSTPDGIPGNDDLGATSGVYVWNALGLYPAVPGVGGFVLGTPNFKKVTLHLAAGRKLVVSRSSPGFYVRQVFLDGVPYSNSWLPLEKIHRGTTRLDFSTDSQPNRIRGTTILDRPPSFR